MKTCGSSGARWHLLMRLIVCSLLAGAAYSALAGKSGGNQPPVVTLTSPANGASYVAPATVSLAATASDPNGTVTRVDFYQGSTLIGTSTTPPYTATWNNVAAGSYTITAKATDNAGAVTTSAPASISVASATALVITSPTNGSSHNLSAGLTVSGTFEGPADSTIIVDNEQSSILATISGNTYTATFWYGQRLAIGTNTITVTLARPDGTSARRTIDVTGYDMPQIVFTEPVCDTYSAPANILLAADAVAPGATITQVQFFAGNTLLATIKAPPYRFNWTSVTGGSYTVRATLTSSVGMTASTTTQIVVQGPNTPPSIGITSPASGATFVAPATIPITVAASDPDTGGSVKTVEYFANGGLFGASNVPPFSTTWANVAAGTYAITARATDDRNGQSISNPVNVTVVPPNQAPVVTITAPTQGATFTAPATVPITAAANDPDGSIARVEFYQGAALIGTATSAPYAFDWTNVSAGTYSLTAKAVDNAGAATASAAVSVTVNASPITITSPQNGSSVDGDRMLVIGTVSAPQYSGIQVNGVPAFTDQAGNFYANNVPLATGSNSVVATLTRADGTTASYPISVTSTGPAAIRIDADPLEGSLPLDVAFSVTATGGASFGLATYDFNGDGAVDYTLNPPGGVVTIPYAVAGVYLPTVTATDSLGRTVTRRFAVLADPDPDMKLRGIFNAMLDRLRAGDVDGALLFITPGATQQYADLFNALKQAGALTDAVNSLGTLRGSTVGSDIGELILTRSTASGTVAYPIWFLRGSDGVWRIDSM